VAEGLWRIQHFGRRRLAAVERYILDQRRQHAFGALDTMLESG
jgi:hypothetical protein